MNGTQFFDYSKPLGYSPLRREKENGRGEAGVCKEEIDAGLGCVRVREKLVHKVKVWRLEDGKSNNLPCSVLYGMGIDIFTTCISPALQNVLAANSTSSTNFALFASRMLLTREKHYYADFTAAHLVKEGSILRNDPDFHKINERLNGRALRLLRYNLMAR